MENRVQKFRVFLKLIEEEGLESYDKCIVKVSKNCAQVLEMSQAAEIEGFIKKDRLAYSPENQHKTPLIEGQKQSPLLRYNFDSVITNEVIQVDTNVNNLVVSIGKSETLSGKGGLIFSNIQSALQENWVTKISSIYCSQGRTHNYLEGSVQIRSFQEAEQLLSFDYFNPKKIKETAVVTTLHLEKDGVKKISQFFDISQLSKISDNLFKILNNSETCENIKSESWMLSTLGQSLTLSPNILIIGNIYPVLPYFQQSKSIR